MHGKLSKLHGTFCGISEISFQLFLENKILPKIIKEFCKFVVSCKKKCFRKCIENIYDDFHAPKVFEKVNAAIKIFQILYASSTKVRKKQ